MIYLASPYSHKLAVVRWWRWAQACRAVANLMSAGFVVFSPIAHCHGPAVLGRLPKIWPFWKKYDETMLDCCSVLVVLQLRGWEASVGVDAEVDLAMSKGKRLYYMQHPGDFTELDFSA